MNLSWIPLLFSVVFGCCVWTTALFAAPTTRPSTRRARTLPLKTRPLLSLQQRFFHLHQTIGHWEAWKTGRCSMGWKRGTQHLHRVLNSQPTRVGHPFLGIEKRLRQALKSRNVTSAQLEEWRMRLHTLAEHWRLKRLL